MADAIMVWLLIGIGGLLAGGAGAAMALRWRERVRRLLIAYDTMAWFYVADTDEYPDEMQCICAPDDTCPRCRLEQAGVLHRVTRYRGR